MLICRRTRVADSRGVKENPTGCSRVKVYNIRRLPLTFRRRRRGQRRGRRRRRRRRRFKQFVFRGKTWKRFHRRRIYRTNGEYRRAYNNRLRHSTWIKRILRWRCQRSIPRRTRFAVRSLPLFHRAIRVLDAILLGSIRGVLLPNQSDCTC